MRWASMAAGLLIALEGIDGSGTSTQMQPLAAYLRERGLKTLVTAEPTTERVGTFIRQALHGEPPLSDASLALMFAADRLHHLDALITPALQAGTIVLTDRYVLSSYAYQASNLPLEWVRQLNARAPLADLNLFFRVFPDTAEARRKQRGKKADKYETDTQQVRVANMYEQLITNPAHGGPVSIINAEGPVEGVTLQVCNAVQKLLQQRGMA